MVTYPRLQIAKTTQSYQVSIKLGYTLQPLVIGTFGFGFKDKNSRIAWEQAIEYVNDIQARRISLGDVLDYLWHKT